MAAPVIKRFTASAPAVKPGDQIRLVFEAFDPDGRILTFTGTASDMQGNSVPAIAKVAVDELKYEVVCDDPTVVISRDPATGEYVATT